MRWQCALVLGVLGLAAGAPPRADSLAARTLIQDCGQRAKPGLRGIEALRADCPALATAIEDLGLNALLPQDWKARVSPRALADLNALADRYSQPAPAVLPSASSLQTIARHMQLPPASITWWERLKHWIASWLAWSEGTWPSWLRFLPHWLPGAVNTLVFVLICLVLIATVAVIALELRAAGVFGEGRRRTRPPQGSATALPSTTEQPPGPADIDAAPAHLRPVLLLRLLVTALTDSQRLERDRDLTCRELITAARFDTKTQREIFASVALLAEQVLYGDPSRPLPRNDEVLGNARGLHRQLAPPAEQPAT